MKRKILVVDSDARAAANLSTKLRTLGVDSLACVSTRSLERLCREEWDLMVADWGFFGLEGGDLLRLLGAGQRPVYICSARSPLEIARSAFESGAKGVFSKKKLSGLMEEIVQYLRELPPSPAYQGGMARLSGAPI